MKDLPERTVEEPTVEQPTAELPQDATNPDPPTDPQKEPEVPNGFFVRLVKAGENERIETAAVGDKRLTEAPTLLRLAAKQVEEGFGL